MKNIIISGVMLLVFTGIGCKNDANTEIESTGPVPTIVAPQINDTNANKIQTLPVTTTPATITSKPVSTAGLNPAHGQPGHRCDISVGAPLDSKPTQPTVQPTVQPQPSTTTTITPQTTTPVTTAAGLNPAHGQPGHRCDIAVGAPLDSKPVQKQ
jgi:hypothetical protein